MYDVVDAGDILWLRLLLLVGCRVHGIRGRLLCDLVWFLCDLLIRAVGGGGRGQAGLLRGSGDGVIKFRKNGGRGEGCRLLHGGRGRFQVLGGTGRVLRPLLLEETESRHRRGEMAWGEAGLVLSWP